MLLNAPTLPPLATTFAAVPPKVLTPTERATIRIAKARAGESIALAMDGAKHRMKGLIIEHVQAQVLGQKAMIGFPTAESAKAAYLANYSDPGFFGSMKTMPLAEFKAKVMTTRADPRMLKAMVVMRV